MRQPRKQVPRPERLHQICRFLRPRDISRVHVTLVVTMSDAAFTQKKNPLSPTIVATRTSFSHSRPSSPHRRTARIAQAHRSTQHLSHASQASV
jgi:hypothetical protein